MCALSFGVIRKTLTNRKIQYKYNYLRKYKLIWILYELLINSLKQY